MTRIKYRRTDKANQKKTVKPQTDICNEQKKNHKPLEVQKIKLNKKSMRSNYHNQMLKYWGNTLFLKILKKSTIPHEWRKNIISTIHRRKNKKRTNKWQGNQFTTQCREMFSTIDLREEK